METLHSAAQSWSYRAPSPPRLLIPPPAFDNNGAPDLGIGPSNLIDFESSGFANSEFLQTVTYGDYRFHHFHHEWKYEQRWAGQKILPFLFLGPITAARNREFLLGHGITMLLAVRNTKSAHARLLESKAAQELNIPYATVDTAGNQELIAAFPRGIEIINTHLSAMFQETQSLSIATKGTTPGKVLVFCESGNERSAAMVVAYIMAMFSMDVIKAIQLVQAQRFAIAFDDATRILLQTYDSILSAKRDVLRSSKQHTADVVPTSLSAPDKTGVPSGMPRRASKRTLDDAIDEDHDMDWNGSEFSNLNENRAGLAPFFDSAGP